MYQSRNQTCSERAWFNQRHICNSLAKLTFINLLIIKAPMMLENPPGYGPKEGSDNIMITGV